MAHRECYGAPRSRWGLLLWKTWLRSGQESGGRAKPELQIGNSGVECSRAAADMAYHQALLNDALTGVVGRLTRLCLVLLVYIALTVFVFRTFIPHIDSALIGPPEDNMQDFWNTWYAASQVKTWDDMGYTNLIKHPEGTTLYYHSFSYPKLVIAKIFGAVFGARLTDLVVLQNLLLIVSFPISAIGGFYLVRHFTRDTFGALAGGAVFAFNPSHVAHVAHHLHVSSIEFIPFFALSFIMAVERRSRAFVVLSTLCFALSALSCWYYLFYCAYFMLFMYAVVAIKQKRFLNPWPLLVVLFNFVGVLVLLWPLLAPMIAQATAGANVYAGGTDTFVADLFGYVAFPPVHLLSGLSEHICRRLAGNAWEATVYLGLANTVLLAWLILRRKELDRGLIAFVLSGMGVFAGIASGDFLHVLGHRTIPLPDLLVSSLPFFKNVRAPSRAIVLVYIFLSIGIGYAVSAIWRACRATWAGRGAVMVLALLMAVDWYPRSLPSTPVVCLPAYSLIAHDANLHVAVLDLPSGYSEGNAYMMYQACHLHPIVDGNVARAVDITLRDRLEIRDLDQQRRQLAENKVKYVVIHRRDGDLFQWHSEDGQAAHYTKTYPVLCSDKDAVVLGVY
jgi:hypothetical protein